MVWIDPVAAASTSSLRIRPPIPVPETPERSIPFSEASLRTSGVTVARPRTGSCGAGAAALPVPITASAAPT